MLKFIQHILRTTLVVWLIALGFASSALADNFGTEVNNQARLSYRTGNTQIIIPTNNATFIIQPPRVTPSIEIFRKSTQNDAREVTLNGSAYSPSGKHEGPFVEIAFEDDTAQKSQNLYAEKSSKVKLKPADVFLTGETLYVHLNFMTANLSSTEIDTVVTEVETETGDIIVLQLFEDAPNSGQFWAFVPTDDEQPVQHNASLSTNVNSNVAASFSSDRVQAEVVLDSVSFNPFNTVFDSVTGVPIDGAAIELIDMNTGEPAKVLGLDRTSDFPHKVTSGMPSTDTDGQKYNTVNGMFTYPFLAPGRYQVKVTPPVGYSFASAISQDKINEGVNNDYVVSDGSYGKEYVLEQAGALRFDIPLDPASDLVVSMETDTKFADVGDFIDFTIQVDNRGSSSTPVNLTNLLPTGFSFMPGSFRLNSTPDSDPDLSDTGRIMSFVLGVLAPNETVTLQYTTQVAPAAFRNGAAFNEAFVIDGNGEQISNKARARVRQREDLLRSRSTIAGRIIRDGCHAEEGWPRLLTQAEGVAGVRIYMETGAYAISDEDGLFHFEGIKEGSHVVQVDKGTLPKGYEIVTCEQNTRYAGNAASQFVDIQGGGIWRTNFYLKQTNFVEEKAEAEEQFTDLTQYQAFDQAWLDTQSPKIAWIYPEVDQTPSQPSVNIGIKHPLSAKVELFVNDAPVPAYSLEAIERSSNGETAMTRWRGVDILPGHNAFKAVVKEKSGYVLGTIHQNISYVDTIARAYGVPDKSRLVADGRTIPYLAIRLEDESGRPVHAGRIAQIELEAPHRLHDPTQRRDVETLSEDPVRPVGLAPEFYVGADGIVKVELEPTLETGRVTAIVTLDTGREVQVQMYLQPEQRDWIIIGLAEGSVGYERIKDKAISLSDTTEDMMTDGRVAFFAKGLIKGNWLLTAAVDTEKRRGGRDGDFVNEIDPNAYYTLYGDRSNHAFEAKSRYPLYLKLEKRNAYALFGDYATNMTQARLAVYNRQLSGLKAEYVGDRYELTGFIAETNQGFAKDEIAADGTSGIYRLSHQNILAQSETVTIETRDRDRPDVILERRELVRYIDYTLDYLTGELIFSFPVDVSDADFNPNVIIVDYETSEDSERNVTFGGRIQSNWINDRLKVGATFVSEDGSDQQIGAHNIMVGVDSVMQVRDGTEVRLEMAHTQNLSTDEGGMAVLAEINHTSEKLNAEVYYREEEKGYGLGQTNSNTSHVRRVGLRGRYKINEFIDVKTGRRGTQFFEGATAHENNLDTGDTRNTVEASVTHQGERLSVKGGLRAVYENFVSRTNRQSVLAITSLSYNLAKYGVIFRASHEQPLDENDETSTHPQRTTFGIDKTLGDRVTLNARYDVLRGPNNNADNAVFGLTVNPWKGSVITASTDYVTQDSTYRLGATLGMDQQIRISQSLAASLGLRNRRMLDTGGEFLQVAPDAAVSPLERNEDFLSGYVGLAYRTEDMAISTRLEGRQADDNRTLIGTASVARKMTEELSMAGAVRVAVQDQDSAAGTSNQIDARLGVAWRPRNNSVMVLNRFDFGSQMDEFGNRRVKFVNNFAANTYLGERLQLTANHGIKHVKDTTGLFDESSLVNLFGGQAIYDLTPEIDIGVKGSILLNDDGSTAYSYGPSLGFTPAKNIRISAGYNFEGYNDEDFAAAEYARDGFYLAMQVKFDQDSLRGLLKEISPSEHVAPEDNL